MIQKLILENWRSHKRSEIEFTKGTNVIIGQMGSGKTSLMDAICFAFYGTFPSLKARKVKLDEVIKNKPVQEKKAKVTLFFDINGENYEIKREIELGKTATAELRKNGLIIAGPQSQRVTEEVTRILQVNYELYSRAVYAEQNNIDYFLQITKSERKQKIDELLQISKFEKAKKTLSQITNRLKERVKEKEKRTTASEETKQIPELEKELTEKKEEHENEKKQQEQLEEVKKEAEKRHDEEKKKKEEYEKITDSLKQLLGKKEYVEKQFKEKQLPLKTEEEIKKEYDEVLKEKLEVKAKKEEKEKIERQKEQAEAEINLNKKRIEELSLKIAQILLPENISKLKEEKKQAVKNYQEELNKIEGEISSKKTSISEVEETIHQVGENDKCPVCEAKLTPKKKNEVVSVKKERIKTIEGEIKKLQEKKEKIKKEIQELNNEIEQIEKEERKANEKKLYEEEKTKAEEALKDSENRFKQAEEKLKELKIEKSIEELVEKEQSLKKQLDYFKLKKEIDELNSSIKSLQEKKEKINYSEKEERKAFEELKNLESEILVSHQKIKSIEEILKEKKARLENLKKLEKEAEINAMQSAYLKKQIESFQSLQNVLNATQTKLREEFIEETNAALTDIWERIYPYGDYVELKLDVDESGDYVLKLRTVNNKWVNAEGITSGGERSSASLALRIAFSLVLTKNLSWLVLDEPTHNLDKKAVEELAKTLKKHLPSLVEQIFLITHETGLEKAATRNIYKLERNKETEEETKVITEPVTEN